MEAEQSGLTPDTVRRMQPTVSVDRSHVPPREVLEARKRMNDAVRQYFDARSFLEVETPIAVPSPGLEPHLEAFSTQEIGPDRQAERLYLHTSPEYAMKRMLGRGLGHLYQLARVFRNGERSRTHAPEFTMLEWYRMPGLLPDVMDDTEELIQQVAAAVGGPWHPHGARRLSVSEAFTRVGLGDPLAFPDVSDLQVALQIPPHPGDSWEDVFFRAFLDRVENTFANDEITILYGYPARMAALARIDPVDPRRAERFEVFLGRMELGNAFGELTDPLEQRRRFEQDQSERLAAGKEVYPIDEGLLQDLARIDTNAAGIAIGLDRLLMRCLGVPAIQDVLCFSPREVS